MGPAGDCHEWGKLWANARDTSVVPVEQLGKMGSVAKVLPRAIILNIYCEFSNKESIEVPARFHAYTWTMQPSSCPEISVTNYQPMPCNILKNWRPCGHCTWNRQTNPLRAGSKYTTGTDGSSNPVRKQWQNTPSNMTIKSVSRTPISSPLIPAMWTKSLSQIPE